MKYCSKCGNAVDDAAEYCPICGERCAAEAAETVDAEPVGSNYGSTGSNDYRTFETKKPEGKSLAGFIIGVASMIICNTFVGPVVGLILSIIGLVSFDESKNTGKWLGIAGIIINSLAILIFTAFVIATVVMMSSGNNFHYYRHFDF